MNKQLLNYLKKEILSQYNKDNSGHGTQHIKTVVKRSCKLAKSINNINMEMVITIAYYHDLARITQKENHGIESAKLFFSDKFMKNYFNTKERVIISEAIEDHSSSLKGEPRSIYGKIISSADRNFKVNSTLKRSYKFCIKNYPNIEFNDLIDKCYNHINAKFGINGYAKMYFKDKKYLNFEKNIRHLLSNKEYFKSKFIKVNKIKNIVL